VQVLLCATVLFIQLLKQFPQLVLAPFREFLQRDKDDYVKFRVKFMRVASYFLRGPLAKVVLLYLVCLLVWQRYGEEYDYLYAATVAVVPILLIETKFYIGTPSSFPSLVVVVVYDMLLNPAIVFNWLLLLTACLGLFYQPLYFAFHLFKAATLSPAIQNVAKSVFKPIRVLALTFLLAAIFIYAFSVVAFFWIPDDFYWNEMDEETLVSPCYSLLNCFLFIFHKGMVSGTGILFAGDYANTLGGLEYEHHKHETWRMVFDLAFFLVVTVCLMNMVFGIMIDTFATLRDEQADKNDQRLNYCFVCCHHRSMFDSHSKFQHHRDSEHNVLDYLYFVVAVLETDADDRNGYETYVYGMIESQKSEWLPIKRAASLQEEQAEDDESQSLELIQQTTADMSARLERLEIDTQESIKRLEHEQGKKLDAILEQMRAQAGVLDR